MRKFVFVMLALAMLVSFAVATENQMWLGNNGVPGTQWNDPNHWQGDYVPGPTSACFITGEVRPFPVLDVDAGVVEYLIIGSGAGESEWITIEDGGSIETSIVTAVGGWWNGGTPVTTTGTLIMNGGYIKTLWFDLGIGNGTISHGYVELNGGFIECGMGNDGGLSVWSQYPDSNIDITGGTLKFRHWDSAFVDTITTNGTISAYGGEGMLDIDFEPIVGAEPNGFYTITATPCPQGDVTGDCVVDNKDVADLASHWLEDNSN